ncbi:MAG: indolepyruvate ferredoxin oxidoreductase family protein [Alphaproteobacteria bacterium]|nr:indolepyruvate ferredoxin oxidoreductase family protein [Alphaproteobacteria bacterium]MBP9776541.1 indolepyruvate ferredoxin oxidoreductase family protein [Alphaproteobacteria bacterium]
MILRHVDLDDKYLVEDGQIYLTGAQALARLPLMQRRRDLAHGLNTAGFISGYRGSPLGAFDQTLWKIQKSLEENQITFTPGINEELGATAVWGSQQLPLFKGARVQGIFSMWYGKGPGVDRCGDAFKHANAAGTSAYGGVLALAGDDHACKSSTLPHQSEYAFMDASIPVLVPSNVQDILDMGLYGWALSRYSGCWVAFKVIADTVDTAASVTVSPERSPLFFPEDFHLPEGGVHIRWPDTPLEQERRLRLYKLDAAKAFVRANHLDKAMLLGKNPRLGLVTCGKTFHDVRQALEDLGLGEKQAADLGITLYKVGMSWPLEPMRLQEFAQGLEEILVIEEKRPLIESQMKDILYGLPEGKRPRVIGKKDENGKPLLPEIFEQNVSEIAHVIGQRLLRFTDSSVVKEGMERLDRLFREMLKTQPELVRLPYYCSGCPHNTSTTHLPKGSRAVAGIGCHYMATWIAEDTATFTQMGGEGVPWIGQAPFTDEAHIFANLGDGTYYHSGILAIRAAIAAKVNMTYKILYNDGVAMTGGQPVDGPLDVAMLTQQIYAEGVRKIVVLSEDPYKYPVNFGFAPGVEVGHRDQLDQVQEDIKKWPGISVLVYDQGCAAEKRRKRKRGLLPNPDQRIFINERVCEGCGDCSVKSNCLSVQPLETAMGRKRKIDQSSCNKDYSCVNGFCPSFVNVQGGKLKKASPSVKPEKVRDSFPDPKLPSLDKPYCIFLTGVGGTGVVTVGTILGMAAHLEKKGCSTVDMTGLAQKGGAVVSHIRIAQKPEDIHATRVYNGEADLIFGCDLVVAGMPDTLNKIKKGKTFVLINADQSITSGFIHNPDYHFHHETLQKNILETAGNSQVDFIDAVQLATGLLGDSIASNLFMVGYAYQKGLLPVSHQAIEKAIEMNDIAVLFNLQAFRWGRLAALDLRAVEQAAAIGDEEKRIQIPTTFEDILVHRKSFLESYQNKAYAERYASFVSSVRVVDQKLKRKDLSLSVAQYYAKLLAIKDEYEVARLYTDGTFMKELRSQFEGPLKLNFYLAPPLFAKRDPFSGELKKKKYGSWMMYAFRFLAKLKGLRGTIFDIFGYSQDRKKERALIKDYEDLILYLLDHLTPDNYEIALSLASLPEHIRGYGHVKERHLHAVKANEQALLAQFKATL